MAVGGGRLEDGGGPALVEGASRRRLLKEEGGGEGEEAGRGGASPAPLTPSVQPARRAAAQRGGGCQLDSGAEGRWQREFMRGTRGVVAA
ncbi:hypothetical protein [Oryza sativa Japonica Group]|uniref:Uncharacterized protein n=1 Tax=Oryza sativa subsp. japonica TaxID=39947 RepID=Q5VNI6_ORYSJ|nr:hypothetical protein [Oryza sativa Japonica Group]BAD73715.1 hypothetical protein [Oryza sativa Japonica Group]